jgi:hypothetical protein
MLNVSAIDVGSNAMRMVIGEVDENWRVNRIENIHLLVRLGEDVFSSGYLEQKTIQQTEEAFLRYKRMAESYNIRHLVPESAEAALFHIEQRLGQILVNWAHNKRKSGFKEVFGVNLEMG